MDTDDSDQDVLNSIRNSEASLKKRSITHIESVLIQGGVHSRYELNVCDECGEGYSYRPASHNGLLICQTCAEAYDLDTDFPIHSKAYRK